MSSFVLNEVTTKPKVGTVQSTAITVTMADAIGEVKGRVSWFGTTFTLLGAVIDINASSLRVGI